MNHPSITTESDPVIENFLSRNGWTALIALSSIILGVVILSYVTADWAAFTVTGGTVTTDGANTVRTFNSSGTLTIAASSAGFFNLLI